MGAHRAFFAFADSRAFRTIPRGLQLLLGGILLSCCGFARAQRERGVTLPDGDGKELVAFACSQCHGLKETVILRDGREGWQEVVDRMVLYGAQLSPSEADQVTRYLVAELGPRTTVVHGDLPSRADLGIAPGLAALPEGAGRELVATRCAQCHDLGKVVSSRRTKADWVAITNNMVQRGMKATPTETQTMIGYLQASLSK